ncbi:MAG: tRNA pseudouridine(55) synthase TruB [Chloroflexota bacterium]
MEGILNIDKPHAMTSHDVVGRVRRVAGLRRVGHTGTLDPMATGVLVVCLGRATRLVEYVVGRPKTYLGVVRLGQTTDSYDADGEILTEAAVPELSTAILEPLLDQFRGDIMQIPPMVSAIKKDGKKLYELAREGKTVERPPRPVTIYELDCLSIDGPDIALRIRCSAGTYIRSIAHDLGQLLGCGGHLISLRREQVGKFDLDSAVSLDELSSENVDSYLQPMDLAVDHLPKVVVSAEDERDLLNGKLVSRQADSPDTELVRVYNPTGRFVGLVSSHQAYWKAKKMFVDAG